MKILFSFLCFFETVRVLASYLRFCFFQCVSNSCFGVWRMEQEQEGGPSGRMAQEGNRKDKMIDGDLFAHAVAVHI